MLEYSFIVDISVLLGEESIDYPGDTPYSRKLLQNLKEDDSYDLSSLSLSAHSGTHIDAPAHFIKGGKTVDRMEPDRFILPAVVINVDDPVAISAETVSRISFDPGYAVLFRTENSTSGRCSNGVFSDGYVYMTKDAADACVKKEVSLVGIDYITIERYGDQAFEAHRALLGADVLVLEGINLNHVPEGKYTLFCLPLKMKGGEASPVRAVLLR